MGFNLWAALIIMLVVCMIIVHMVGCMAISGINGNAMSLVTLIVVGHSSKYQITSQQTLCFTNQPLTVLFLPSLPPSLPPLIVSSLQTVGISVEFFSHIVHWFCSCSEDTCVKHAHSALANMGASVVSGITLTKLLGSLSSSLTSHRSLRSIISACTCSCCSGALCMASSSCPSCSAMSVSLVVCLN